MTPPLPPLTDDDIAAARKLADDRFADACKAIRAAIGEYIDRWYYCEDGAASLDEEGPTGKALRLLEMAPRLLAEVERLRAENAEHQRMREALGALAHQHHGVRDRLRDEVIALERQLRARELTADERETLSRLRDQTAAYGRNPKALAVLDKLLKETP